MTNRWTVLFVLFFARLMMAFQYQSVAALSPQIVEGYAASLADIGFLIGLYLGPGVIVAIPGGTLGARFGDRRVVGCSIGLMLVGTALMAMSSDWGLLMAGRVLAGIGGVVVNVVMTKMVVDWFVGREIGTAMGIFISSWPLGIALALLVLPAVAVTGGLGPAWAVLGGLILVSLMLFLAIYRLPQGAVDVAPLAVTRNFPVAALVNAALIWALYNTALAMVFGFGSLSLIAREMTPTAAGSVIGVFTLSAGVGVPLGGYLSDRLGRDPVIFSSLIFSTLMLPALLMAPMGLALPAFALTGLVFGLAAGPIMTLPSQVLPPEARSFGMGVFFAIYYGVMMVGPALGGGAAELAGYAGTAFLIGTLMLAASALLLAVFRRQVRAIGSPAAV